MAVPVHAGAAAVNWILAVPLVPSLPAKSVTRSRTG